ncbi:MAG TPA: NAD-dependent epimerase/dehydratase family protein [Candidatus Dormibacteraeota bacterium]
MLDGTSGERFLVTGALGCIGAWTVRLLDAEGTPVVATDLAADASRWRLLDPGLEERVPLVRCDVTSGADLERLVGERGITHVVHLAALQVPFVRAKPTLGARVNVEGTAVVLEVARALRHQVRGVSFASSIAVYGPSARYGPGPLPHDAAPAPATLYGAYKLANEWMARVYEQDHGVVAIGLRGAVVYGPGRDQGLTSSPTLAMLAAAAGRPHRIAWGGSAGYHHARDVAAGFIAAARASADGGGSETYTLPVETASMEEVVAAIREAAGDAPDIAFEPSPLPFPDAFETSALERRLGGFHLTPLREGVRETVETFRTAAAGGRLDVDRLLGVL